MPNKCIIIDTYGSDKGIKEIIEGTNIVLSAFNDIDFILVGDKNIIEENINDLSRIKVIDTTTFISNNDNIINSLFDKPNASIFLALKELKENNNAIGLISPGNSGAILLGVMKYFKKENNRPCLAALLPNNDDSLICIVDVGATLDCNPQQLHNFALLGRDFMANMLNINNPRVGLLSIGEEPTKGNKLVKDTYQILSNDKNINFIGNVEGNNIFNGICDVLVCDGFTGNQILKTIEGVSSRIIKDIDDINIKKQLLNKYDVSNLGGGLYLGIDKPVIKLRGNSSKEAIYNVSRLLINGKYWLNQ